MSLSKEERAEAASEALRDKLADADRRERLLKAELKQLRTRVKDLEAAQPEPDGRVRLGDRVKCRVTGAVGAVGTVTCLSHGLHGVPRWEVTFMENDWRKEYWCYEPGLEVLKRGGQDVARVTEIRDRRPQQ